MQKLLSVVIPVYNSSKSITKVVEDVHLELSKLTPFEIILVNDGSLDNSAEVCKSLFERFPATVRFLNLSRNFGEHNAVYAGLCHAKGDYAVMIDDDGQNPPSEIPKLFAEILKGPDVVYGFYKDKRHDSWRNWGSQFNDLVASRLIGKPRDLYLSSFKIINRFVIDHLKNNPTPYPYLDSMIFHCTTKATQIEVFHKDREIGTSNYNLRRLFFLWTNMLTTSSSILPLRLATVTGFIFACLGFVFGFFILIEALFYPTESRGWASLAMAISIFSGIQLFALGLLGEYVGRIFQSGYRSPFVVREAFGVDKHS